MAESQQEIKTELKAINKALEGHSRRLAALEQCKEGDGNGPRPPALLIRMERPALMRMLWIAGVAVLLIAVGFKLIPASALIQFLIPGAG